MNQSLMIGDTQFIVSPYVTDYERVRRTLKERLFTRPWRPLQAFKSVYAPKAYRLVDGTFLVSPRLFSELAKIDKRSNTNGDKNG